MKILVTGASGLVGGCVLREFLAAGVDAAGTYGSRPQEGLVPLQITDREAVRSLLLGGGYTHVVHAAAVRSPDECLAHPETAYRVNALAVEYLAETANDADALFCQIGTDFVFSGEHPPYRETDRPDPVNLYGRTKLAGEHAARRAARHLILRIPAQWRADLADSRNVAAQYAERLAAGETLVLDAHTVRYYTLSEDVARAVRFLFEAGETGLFHLSAEQKTTKAAFARKLAEALGFLPDRVQDGPIPATGDVRPFDSHLATDRYAAFGGPAFSDIDSALAKIAAARS